MLFGLFGKRKEGKEVLVGEVVHYFRKVNAVVVKVKNGKISVGDEMVVKRHADSFRQKIQSMQIDHNVVNSASKGDEVAIKIKKKARPGSKIYVIE
ncbi:MAG: hypothetical protein ABH862_05145 [Candidatus Omnitrophota bacterium]